MNLEVESGFVPSSSSSSFSSSCVPTMPMQGQEDLIIPPKSCTAANGTAHQLRSYSSNKNNNEKSVASILAIGRATPPFQIDQSTYTDFYFNITNSNHNTHLRNKFARICERSGIKTRYSILSEEFLKDHPEFYTPGTPSMEERNAIFAQEVPKLAHQAALNAFLEWGRPAADITHLIVATLTGIAIPGADVTLVKSLGLRHNVNRVMLYMLGCYAGVTALRVAKDLAENNPGARVLICCSELAAPTFRAPDENHPYDLVGTALFGDGASAIVVGAAPTLAERPLYEIHWCGETVVPGTEKIIEGKIRLDGLQFYLDRALPSLVSSHVAGFCRGLLDQVPSAGTGKALGFNDVFWAVHSGGPAILKAVEEALQLEGKKLGASRDILANYGNVSASTVLFVLDELRKSKTHSCSGIEWGVLVAFGPGITIEGALLRNVVPK